MLEPEPLSGVAGSAGHFAFVERTDRRNLHTQLKNLVSLAQNIAARDLNARRNKLRMLIEHEDKMFEEEFANSAKARLQSEMKKPESTTEKDAQKIAEFKKKKHIQQCMNCCYELRDVIRKRNNEETRICLEQQMLENERKIARQREEDKYWLKVQQINLSRADDRQKHEDCITEWRRNQVCHVLGAQLKEKEDKLEEERREKAAEVERINNLLKEIQLEELNRSTSSNAKKMAEYAKELQATIEEKRLEREEEKRQAAWEHCQLMSDIAREEEREREEMAMTKQNHKKALLDFISYIKCMRKMESDLDKIRDDRIDDLYRVDICTKRNISEVLRQKAEKAEQCYAELRRQVCEQLERKRLEEIERREDKIIENRFVHPFVPRHVVLEKRQKFREELDRQIEQTRILRAQEEAEYKKKLLRATNDPEYCSKLAEEYMNDGFDYLEPHPNWLTVLDPCKQYVPKGEGKQFDPANRDAKQHYRHHIKEPLVPVMTCLPPKSMGPCAPNNHYPSTGNVKKTHATDKCIVPCGCEKRWKLPC